MIMAIRKLLLLLFILSLLATPEATGQEPDTVKSVRGASNSLYAEDNENNCLVCHGRLVYSLTDTTDRKSVV